MIGDARPYNAALLVLDPDSAPMWAAQNGIERHSLAGAGADERVRAAVQARVDEANAKLARVEQVKKFTILDATGRPAATS